MIRTAFALAVALSATAAEGQTPPKTVNSVNTPARATNMAAPSILIPPSSVGLDLCLGEDSGAYGSPMLAITLSVARRDRVCSLLRQSKWAADLGEPEVAREIMCESGEWRAASARAGRPCKGR